MSQPNTTIKVGDRVEYGDRLYRVTQVDSGDGLGQLCYEEAWPPKKYDPSTHLSGIDVTGLIPLAKCVCAECDVTFYDRFDYLCENCRLTIDD